MQSQNVNEKQIVSILDSAFELAKMMQIHPALVEKEEFEKGQKILNWFETQISNKILSPELIPELNNVKKKLICFAIEDLSAGAPVLSLSCVGFKAKNMSILPFNFNMTELSGNKSDPQVLLQVHLRRDKNTEPDQPILLSTEQMNSAIYYLIVLLSQIE